MNSFIRNGLRACSVVVLLIWSSLHAAAAEPYRRTVDGVVIEPHQGPARQVRLVVMSDRIIRVTATPARGLNSPKSLAVTAAPNGKVPFTLQRLSSRKLQLRTQTIAADIALDSGTVSFQDLQGHVRLAEQDRGRFDPEKVAGADFYSIQQVFNPNTDEAFYGLGQHQNAQMNYNGEDVLLAQHNMDVAIPFVLSSRNYGVLWDNSSITRFGDPRPYAPVSRDLKIYDAGGKQGGFTARYFVDGKLTVERVESDIDYQYMKDLTKRPPQVLGTAVSNTSAQRNDIDKLQVVWEGRLQTDHSGVHKFQLYASSYFKLWIDGKRIKEGWRQNWNPWYHNFDLPMQAGVPVAVRLEWTPDDGYIALLHNNPLPRSLRHSLSLSSEAAHAIDYYYIAGNNLDEVIAGYRHLTGKAVMLPRWAYGFWQSRQRYKTQQEILDVVREYRSRDIPLDNIVEDWFYWPQDAWGSHQFDPARFPDPKGMIDQLHDLHTHFMISVWPKFYPTTANYHELDAKGYIYRRNVELGVRDWVGSQGYLNSFYDPYSLEARGIYWRQIQQRLKILGVDAWWLDASEPDIHSNIDIDENKQRMGPTAIGPGAAVYNSYPLMHTTAVYEGERASGDTRPFILTRSAFAGQQRNAAAVWSGDAASRWDDLHQEISAGVNFSMSGIPNWTFDIGGFALEKRYLQPNDADLAEWRELNTRWFEFGAFAPLFRSHGEEPFREIYNLAPKESEVYRTLVWYDELRYRLLPYIYTLAADTYHRDGTIMRGLVMDFPQDRAVRNIDDEYLFGPALLVSPVYEYGARKRQVYLPAGALWYDFYTGNTFNGGASITADAPLEHMPIFVKAGTILPLGPKIRYTGQSPTAPITLYVFTGASGSFELYEDDGVSQGYERGEFSRIPLTYDESARTLTIGARSGAFPQMQHNRTFKVRWISGPADVMNFDADADATVEYVGQPIKVARASMAAPAPAVALASTPGPALAATLAFASAPIPPLATTLALASTPGPALAATLALASASIPTLAATPALAPAQLPRAVPESVGFSSERLALIDPFIAKQMATGRLPGVSIVLLRHGKVVLNKVYGKANLDTGAPLQPDSLFRIYSQTKPIIGVAMMILFEQGLWHFDDPVTRFIPEFEHLRVFKAVRPDGTFETEAMTRSPNLRELLTHSAGFAYGLDESTPVETAFYQADFMRASSTDAAIATIAGLPLYDQPGRHWHYSASVDIQGYIIERLSGQTLAEFLQTHLFGPLGMRDTAFWVPPQKWSRLVGMKQIDAQQLQLVEPHSILNFDYSHPPAVASGGAGLVSTLQDYARFAQMLANGGELNGVRILAPATVKLLDSNHLSDDIRVKQEAFGTASGVGFGVDVNVTVDTAKAGTLGGLGSFGWGGAAGSNFWVDPTNDVVCVSMMQVMDKWKDPVLKEFYNNLTALVYAALVRPQN